MIQGWQTKCIEREVLILLNDFLLFSLYSFSCIAKHVMTLKQL